ncbi:hypothetical protein [Phytohabitans houttuyneae]|uniref:hypothetical protein n=1 Tax=Phytohabitans houttuyneae TaxID=1076126 RepID=UPI001563FDA7|nr:hypothetical protein [Phytohabitans houttuyneae]
MSINADVRDHTSELVNTPRAQALLPSRSLRRTVLAATALITATTTATVFILLSALLIRFLQGVGMSGWPLTAIALAGVVATWVACWLSQPRVERLASRLTASQRKG